MDGSRSCAVVLRAGVPRREDGLLLPSLVRLAVIGGEVPACRGVI
jgi:hypothetical protein